jgi:hypothetical protein
MHVCLCGSRKRTAYRKFSDTIKLAILSVEPLRFVGESPQIKDKETYSRTTELAQGQLNLLKDN